MGRMDEADTAGKPLYHGYEVLRVERLRTTAADGWSRWYAVMVGDDDCEHSVDITVREADHLCARVPTVEVSR